MLTRARKTELVTELNEKFEKSKATFLVNCIGMNVDSITQLRKKLVGMGSEIKVVRNTLALRALENFEEEKNILESKMIGPNAFVFSYEDPSASAKALVEESKSSDHFEVKSGVMSGQELNAQKVEYLSKLPGKDELRAKLLGTLQAPAQNFVRVLNAVPSGLVNVLSAKKKDLET